MSASLFSAYLLVFTAILAASTLALDPIINPVIQNENLPDPGAIFYGGYYYVVNTASNLPSKFPIHRSTNLQDWQLIGYVFPEGHLPSWTTASSSFWAPELHIINGKFRVYFTGRETGSNILCIGVGYSDDITGPYTDRGSPLIKNTTVGSIDATVMTIDDGTSYLVWKDDGNGNVPKIPTWIWAQQLTEDGLDVTGGKTPLIRNTLAWEDDLVEGPWVIKRNDYYYLFYSGHGYCDRSYAVGVARSKNPLGPYEKKGDPILKTGLQWSGPGHCSVIQDQKYPGQLVMLYHAWHQAEICGNNPRLLLVDYVQWTPDNWPYMATGEPRTFALEF